MATIFDLFEVTDISSDTTYSNAAGNLPGVLDGMSSADLDDGEFDLGDEVRIDGVTYTIDVIKEPSNSGRFTLGDGTDVSFNPASESNLEVVFLTISNGPDVRHFIIPNDSFGDINVQSIRTGSLNNVAGSDAATISTADNAVNVVCFVSGTRIRTPDGDVPVETIKLGDLVLTRDNGPQAVRKVLVRQLDFAVAPTNLRPIAFEKDALGPGRPDGRLCVSPQHRMLLTDAGGQSVLVPAKALIDRKGVRIMQGKRQTTYIHIVFSRHEIIRANGALTESFFPGPMALSSIPAECRSEVEQIFGQADARNTGDGYPSATPIMAVRKARLMAHSLA